MGNVTADSASYGGLHPQYQFEFMVRVDGKTIPAQVDIALWPEAVNQIVWHAYPQYAGMPLDEIEWKEFDLADSDDRLDLVKRIVQEWVATFPIG